VDKDEETRVLVTAPREKRGRESNAGMVTTYKNLIKTIKILLKII